MNNGDKNPSSPALVSVVVPTYDSAAFLGDCLDAVFAQDHEPLEVIVVDDGSSDGTAALCRRYQLRYLHQPHQGVAAARNAGVAAATGPLVAFVDADDLWEPDKLSSQVRTLDDTPEAGGAITLMRYFLEPGYARPPSLRPELLDAPQEGNVPSTLLLRRATLDVVGSFDTSLQIGDDSDWLFRAKDAGVALVTVPRVLVHKRMHGANLSLRTAPSQRELLAVARASIVRQRCVRGDDEGGEA